MSASDLIDSLESAYGVTLPESYKTFLSKGQAEKYPSIELSGYIRGEYNLDFEDELLGDVAELGMNAGIYDMDDVPWSDDYTSYVPLASLSHEDVDEPKMFLVLDVETRGNPVLLFHYDGWYLLKLKSSFTDFLAALPHIETDIKRSVRPGNGDDDEDESDDEEE